MVFADPPDNLGMEYAGFEDHRPDYEDWLKQVTQAGVGRGSIFWLSYYHLYQDTVWSVVPVELARQFIWRFTFGQHRNSDCGNGYRPLMRVRQPQALIYPDAIRVPSARQVRYHDPRANPEGRVPDDVWEFPRVCGTFRERRRWISNQHPEALIERIVLLSTQPGDLVIDMFAGSGTVHRVCKRLDRRSISIEISPTYVAKIGEEDISVAA